MKKTPTLLRVHGEADGKSVVLGKLSYDARRVSAAFAWSPEAIETGVEWSPIMLPLSTDLWVTPRDEKGLMGLPGLIHDAMPDGWGLLLMDRAFSQRGIPRGQITPMLRLSFLADRCWGALRFDPEWGSDVKKEERLALEKLAIEAQRIQEGDTEQVSKALLMAGGSPHGARPKIMVAINDDLSRTLIGYCQLPDGYRHVLIKFAGENETPTVPIFEYCYGEAARGLGIDTSRAEIIKTAGRYGLCLDRFDRENGQRQHIHSMSGMLHTSHRIPNSDWIQVAQILNTLDGGARHLDQGFRRAVFNAVFCVRDDHTKNISFRRTPDGKWGLSPAYDLTYSEGAGGYHSMTYAEHTGQNVGYRNMVAMAEYFDFDPGDINALIQSMQHARENMIIEAVGMGVPKSVIKEVGHQYRKIDRALKMPATKPQRGHGP